MWAFLAMNRSSNFFTFEIFNLLASLWRKKEEQHCPVNSVRKLETRGEHMRLIFRWIGCWFDILAFFSDIFLFLFLLC